MYRAIVGNSIPNFNDIVQRVAEIFCSPYMESYWIYSQTSLVMAELIDEYSLETLIKLFWQKKFLEAQIFVYPHLNIIKGL